MRDLRELKMNEGYRPIEAGPLVLRSAPTAEVVEEFEKRFEVKLPSDYVEFLSFCNGGHPQLSSFVPKGREAAWEISLFYHLSDKRKEAYGIWRAALAWRNAGHRNSIPIAGDPFGNKIVLSFDTSPPRVRLFAHDEDEVFEIANSFSAFLDTLFFDPNTVVE